MPRLKNLILNRMQMELMIRGRLRITDLLPDTTIVGMGYDIDRDCIYLRVTSSSFEHVGPGEKIPMYFPTTMET